MRNICDIIATNRIGRWSDFMRYSAMGMAWDLASVFKTKCYSSPGTMQLKLWHALSWSRCLELLAHPNINHWINMKVMEGVSANRHCVMTLMSLSDCTRQPRIIWGICVLTPTQAVLSKSMAFGPPQTSLSLRLSGCRMRSPREIIELVFLILRHYRQLALMNEK
jgi:hypothetical protein